MADRPLRWGILGTGNIASSFTGDLALLDNPRAEAVAVGSRAQPTADAFADRFRIRNRYDSYQKLVEDPDVDVVYVSTPHALHYDNAMLAIEAGKAVLVEKPFTINAAQARSLIDAARARGTFLMEAMWTRFLPHVVRIREIVASGQLGDVRSLQADHGQCFAPDPSHRLFDPHLGGGALLDLGIYPVSFASMLFGTPQRVVAVGTPAFTGVDAQTSIVLQYAGGQHASLFTSLETRTPNRAVLGGTLARIEVDGFFLAPSAFQVIDRDGKVLERHNVSHAGHGLRHQAAEVARCLRNGRLESDVMPLDETLAIMETLDEIRRQIGVRYPGEKG